MWQSIIFITVVALVIVFKSAVKVRQEQLAGVFRLGKFLKVLKPGLHFVGPYIDRVEFLDIKKSLPGWRGYSAKQLEEKVSEVLIYGKPIGAAQQTKPAHSGDFENSADLQILTDWLLESASRQTGVNLRKDPLASTRLAEQAHKVISEISSSENCSISLPYITADVSGPKHFNLNLTKSEFDKIVSGK